ncbi:MAG: DUF4143 domain-containing protein [Planctomycetaceae bacterium]|jgi:predicted AAA+ superfamily ATPase|nr:DUF4143 domain-containing protein [Planctomycetaceae bacterium]
MKYLKRIIDRSIEEKLEVMGCVVVRGPKWCGKTTTSRQFAKSVIELQDPVEGAKYQELAENNIKLLLEGEKPRLIDEWQLMPNIWNAIRYDVDKQGKAGLYLLTGSVTPIDKSKKGLHSGIGRMSFVTMYPMSLYESGNSNGSISLKSILDGKAKIDGQKSDITYENLAYLTCRGGWPSAVNQKKEELALKIAKEYLDVLCESDIENDNENINPKLTRAIIRAYSRLVCSIKADKTLFEDIRNLYGDVSDMTIINYLNKLKRLFVIEDVNAWNPNIISKTNVRTASKKIMVDSSIACAALECSPKELAMDPMTFGLLFENLVDRDLRIYANSLGGYLRHYRDRYGLECDQVIHFDNGEYGLIQTKLGTKNVKDGAEKLLKLQDKIKKNGKKEPKFLMVITGSDIAYKTKEGVLIVPIGCLKD